MPRLPLLECDVQTTNVTKRTLYAFNDKASH